MKAMKWALDNEYLRIYPQVIQGSAYKYKGKKIITLPYVKLVVEIGNAKHVGEQRYKQHQITGKICELYQYYYNKSK